MSTFAFIAIGLIAELGVVYLAYLVGYDSGVSQD